MGFAQVLTGAVAVTVLCRCYTGMLYCSALTLRKATGLCTMCFTDGPVAQACFIC